MGWLITKQLRSTLICCVAACSMLANGVAAAQSKVCSRQCLQEMLDRYLAAVIAHDPSHAPLFIGFRQTENAVVVPRGGGLWQTATGLGQLQRRYFDPLTGQAVYFGTINEGPTVAIVSVRILVTAEEIMEAEWYISRKGDPGIDGPGASGSQSANLYDPDYLIANPPPERSVPVNERLSRSALVAVTNSYFDGITSRDGKVIMAHPGCRRVENGFQTTGRPLPPERLDDGHDGKGDCTSGMSGFSIALVAARRYPLIDEEAQVVLGTAVFVRSPGAARRRNCFAELFYIDGGRIREIYAAMFYPPPDQPVPNWPPYDGNFPVVKPITDQN